MASDSKPKTPRALPNDPREWRAGTVDIATECRFPLLDAVADALEEVRERAARTNRTEDLRLDSNTRSRLSGQVRPILDALERGRGFAIVDGSRLREQCPADATAVYWLFGQLLGKPFVQNVQGTLLYDVRDTGQQLEQGARFSVTSYESSFHTDNSFGSTILDYVGLLCLQPAKAGGVSQVVSGFAAYRQLEQQFPSELQTLCQPFHVDRRGGAKPGETPTAQFPVIEWRGNELLLRYLRYWIEAGHAKVETPLTDAQRRALDCLDTVLNQPELRVEFLLDPGEMFFINNRWILHNRTAFQDYEEPGRRRHYVRLWLEAEPNDN